jgi:hypothetical protein
LALDEVEPQADLMSISQESANAQDRWAVTKVRMHMKMQCRKSDVNWEEFKQFDAWSFGRQLQFSRKRLNEELTGSSQQHEEDQLPRNLKDMLNHLPDPLQDQKKDPWTRSKMKTEMDEGKKGTRPQEYLLIPPRPANLESMSPGPPAPGLETSGAANTLLGSLPRPSKGRFPKFPKTKKNKKKIFMDSCEGHLKELYKVIGQE